MLKKLQGEWIITLKIKKMYLKLWLSILMVCGMAESIGSGKDWHISVPSKIPVLQGSCVVIPCKYVYPKKAKTLMTWRGYWKRGNTVVATNFPNVKLTDEFNHRSRIKGFLESGNCTWQLNHVRKTDTGPFYFKIEIPQYKSFTFSNNKVTLDIYRVPEPPIMSVAVLNELTATCKVTHACPSSPPKLFWSHTGMIETKSKKKNELLWTTMSTITFTPQEADFNKPLNCTVRFHGRKTTHSSVLLIK
ncbi:myelin-associated glycoprotein-like isoform X1 [Poecilia reticulata]|uniref:myelin-associated glycoprotein-like isoform X1 n=1 Tax=Poecilia reticulata TaxID=8081 RepID=UPI0004A50058|nr:PREDICTED: myelin-associated glycoprotein-like isoform X1 [Poecilia reticulata]